MKYTGFEEVLQSFAEDVNNAAKRELGSRRIGKNRSYGVTSRRSLQKSLSYKIGEGRVAFGSPLPYAGFLHWGVNGTRKSHGAPYSYRFETPSRKHVDAIEKWMSIKPVRVRGTDGRFVSKVGPRGGNRVRSAAYLIARSVKRKGIVGLRYYNVALESVLPQYQAELGEALALDLMKSLDFKAGNITIKSK